MEIKVNNTTRNCPENFSLFQLLCELSYEKQNGIAAAVNSVIVPKNNWKEHLLYNNDNVLIIKAAQGG